MAQMFILFSALLSLCIALSDAKGCQQCTGTDKIYFNKHVSPKQATDFFKKSIAGCATGADYKITYLDPQDCRDTCVENSATPDPLCIPPGHPPQCVVYAFSVSTEKYCATGESVTLKKFSQCYDKVCSYADFLDLKCTKAVDCAATCDSKACSS